MFASIQVSDLKERLEELEVNREKSKYCWLTLLTCTLVEHLLKAAKLVLRPKVIALFEDANKLLKKVKMDFSVQEGKF